MTLPSWWSMGAAVCVSASAGVFGTLASSAFRVAPAVQGGRSQGTTWQLVEDWPRLPSNVRLGQVSGVSVDARGHVFVFHRAGRTFDRAATAPIEAPTVLELDAGTGAPIAAWGAGMFLIPHSVTVDRSDNVWVTDVGRHQVFKFSHDGRLLLEVGQRRVPGWDATHFNEPTDVAVSADGSFFVSDGYQNARVAHFNARGEFLKEWGTKGPGQGQFVVPHGLALDGAGRVYVADRENSRLQVFDTTGAFLRVWPGTPSVGRVFAVAVGSSGAVYLARKDGSEAARILDAAFRDAGTLPSGIGGLVTPHAIAAQGDSVIYIADTGGERLRKFVRR